jgi:hypothetical protein
VVLDANGEGRVFDVQAGGQVWLVGLDITGGYSSAGGGLFVAGGGVANLDGCNVFSNEAYGVGAGLFVNIGGVANLNGCQVYENVAQDAGGGLAVESGGTANLEGCKIFDNVAQNVGAGLAILGTATLTYTNVYKNVASAVGDQLYIGGPLTATSCTFSYRAGSDVAPIYLTSAASQATFVNAAQATFENCTFNAAAGTPAHALFIYAAGVSIDYGNCTPGTSPGEEGDNILVAVGNFTGCPFRCPLGTSGPGGATNALRAIDSGCGVGCKTCPAGAVCDALGLPAPIRCTAGHYNPDTGSQTEGSCRPCEI